MSMTDDWLGHQVELESCWWDGEPDRGAMSRVGHSGVVRIVLRADGSGPTSQYDRIHVFNENGRHLIFPAHHVSGWSVLRGSSDAA